MLFCFPSAGGEAAEFCGWQAHLPVWIDVCPVKFSGPATHLQGLAADQFESLVRAFREDLRTGPGLPFAFFGHGAGALVGFEVARRLQQDEGHGPTHLFVAGHDASQSFPSAPEIRPPFRTPIIAFGGLDDGTLRWHRLDSWREQTTGVFRLRLLPGGHLFLQRSRPALLRLIAEDIASPPGPAQGVGAVFPHGAEVHLWRVWLDQPTENLAGLTAVLSADEQQRASRFLRVGDRARFVACRAALRWILGRYGARPAESCRFDYGPYGKPRLLDPPEGAALQFNVSHSGGLALVAIARDRPVGVDLEQLHPDVDIQGVGRMVFSVAEQDALQSFPEQQRLAAFFDFWTRKESYLKAIGRGFSGLSQQVTVTSAMGAEGSVLEGAAEGPSRRWFVANFSPAPGYTAAVAVEGDCSHCSCGDYRIGE
jgi:4'-phosphopantetheinyl transferase